MASSQQAAFLIAYDALCSKMQKEYKQISKSTEPKSAIIKKIDKLCWDYEREYDNLQIQFAQVEGIHWSEVRKGFNVDKDRFTNLKWKLKGKLCPRCQILLIEKGFKYCYDCQKKVWAENEKERQKQWKKIKLSHCNYCEKQPTGGHYIYDLTTKTLESSTNNASDPDKQWLFCSETHFEKWHQKNYYCCAECLTENYTGKYKYNKKQKDGQKFCSDNCYYTHYAETCDNCLIKCVSNYQGKATGYAQTYYSDGTNKTGTLCSKCHQEKLKEKREEQKKDQEWEENCKRLDKTMDDLVEGMEEVVKGEEDLDNSDMDDSNSNGSDNSNNSDSDVSNKEKSKNITKQLQSQITNLENKPNKTKEEQELLDSKKKELEELLKKQNSPTSNQDKADKTGLYVGLGIIGVILVLSIFIMARIRKKSRKY